jgi:fructose/tagatose bisphosphate aldolase
VIEGEIGDIGTGSEIHDVAPDLSKGLTAPGEAKQYVDSTGVDILAPAVGNMHGMVVSMIEGLAGQPNEVVPYKILPFAVEAPTFAVRLP